ncbi:MAG TPA: hypothetical protein VK395_10175 [Gemmataceae bacterium]|nr:hypothetical protein [Gemmataceae bacterium]
MALDEDPLRQIANSLSNLERLYAEQIARQKEQQEGFAERQKEFDERRKRFEKRSEQANLYRNPWLVPGNLAYLFHMIATAVLALAVIFLVWKSQHWK